jgi:hypothetical protein
MADVERVKREIREIAGRSKNVKIGEIQRIVKQLGELGFLVESRETSHGVMFQVGTEIFHVCTHNRGSSQLKQYTVQEFLDRMTNLGLLKDEED